MFGGSEFMRRVSFLIPLLLLLLWSRRRDGGWANNRNAEKNKQKKKSKKTELVMTMTTMATTMSKEKSIEDSSRIVEMESVDSGMEGRGEREKGGEKGGGGGEIVDMSRKQRFGNHRWPAVNSGVTTMMMMENSCKLPDHLIESVLARLPLQSFFRFRAVCSSWNSLVYSPTFLKAYSEATICPKVWFFVMTANFGGLGGRYGRRNSATYDPDYNNWHCIPLPPPLRDLNPQPTAADGGLVCYFAYENRLRTLFVCNPLTKSLRKLPQVMKNSSHISVLKMVVEDRGTNVYKVFVAGVVPGDNGDDTWSMEVYDSTTDCWSTRGIIPARYPKRRPVYGNGVLYVKCYDQRSLLLTYDMNADAWNRIHAPLPCTLGYEELVQYEGHILLVGVLEENYKVESVCIWEFQKPGLEWKLMDTMPRDLFMEFFSDPEYFDCQEDERVIMKSCKYSDLILCVAFNSSDRGPFKVLAYDLSRKRWCRLPDSFRGHKCRTHKFIEGIIYEPRLDVFA